MVKEKKLASRLAVGFLAISAVGAYTPAFSKVQENPSNSVHDGGKKAGPANLPNTQEPAEGKGTDVQREATSIASQGNGAPGNGENAQLEKKITDILNANPQIIVGALQKFSQNQQHARQEKLEASLMKYQKEILEPSNAVVLGKKDAAIKLVVFLDPNCPHCRPFLLALDKLREGFPDVAVWVRHWAILGNDSEDVVRGLWAIKQQREDEFHAATKAIASSEELYTLAKLLSWVKDHNLNVEKFKKDFESQSTKNVVDETKKLASDIGLEGTPTSLLIDKKSIRLVTPTDEKSLEDILRGATKAS